MTLRLRPAAAHERAFCEALSRSNMAPYLAARNLAWDPARFRQSWVEFENLLIESGSEVVGVLRLLPEAGGLGLRDLQIAPEHQGRGIGSWAIRQAQRMAVERGFSRLQLRVYAENPAAALYARLGFVTESVVDAKLHLAWSASGADPCSRG